MIGWLRRVFWRVVPHSCGWMRVTGEHTGVGKGPLTGSVTRSTGNDWIGPGSMKWSCGRCGRAVGVIILALALAGCQGVWDNRANGGELVTLGTPNPCQPKCPAPEPEAAP